MAWTTGIWLIALCYEMVLKYIVKVDDPPTWIGVVHGWVYFVYLLFTANLAVKVRWPIAKTIGVLLAGTIPLLGIIVEQVQTREIKSGSTCGLGLVGPVAGLVGRRCRWWRSGGHPAGVDGGGVATRRELGGSASTSKPAAVTTVGALFVNSAECHGDGRARHG